MDAKVRTDLQVWVEKMGFNAKQVSEAAQLFGLGSTQARATSSGVRALTVTDRLAMAALRAGLPEWSPETDQEIADLAAMREIIKRASARGEP